MERASVLINILARWHAMRTTRHLHHWSVSGKLSNLDVACQLIHHRALAGPGPVPNRNFQATDPTLALGDYKAAKRPALLELGLCLLTPK